MRAFIDILNEKLSESRLRLWSYNITGNVVELNVLPNMDSELHDFRLAVIQIGQVLDRLRSEYSHCIEQPQIQTFPNLMEINLVAVVHFTHSTPDRSTQSSKNGINRGKSGIDLKYIQELAEKHHFKVHQTEVNLTELKPDHEDRSKVDAFVLYSNSDNPFVWLQVGYFTEQIKKVTSLTQKPELEICLFNADKVHSAIKEESLNGSTQAILFYRKTRDK